MGFGASVEIPRPVIRNANPIIFQLSDSFILARPRFKTHLGFANATLFRLHLACAPSPPSPDIPGLCLQNWSAAADHFPLQRGPPRL